MTDVAPTQAQQQNVSATRSASPASAEAPASWLDCRQVRPSCAPDAIPEAIEAGFTRDPDGPFGPVRGRVGFEDGGPADVMAPCSVLAELAGQTADRMGELTDDELVGVLRAARRVQSWQAALELEAVSELAARRLAEPARPGPRPGERVAAELAAVLVLTRRSADNMINLATAVERLDGVRDALAAGQIDLNRARVFADELAVLDWLKACRIAAKVMLDAPRLTTSQLRARLRSAVLAADPEAGRRRQAAAKDHARVESWDESSGNAGLAGRELPPAAALAADRHVNALARALKAAGAEGTLDQLRASVYLALLSGREPSTLLPASAASPQPGAASEVGNASEATTGSEAGNTLQARTGSTTGGHGPALSWPSGPRGTIHLTMPLSAWLGNSDRPGQVAEYGPVDAWTCRDIASDLADESDTRCCLTLTTEEGYAVGHACSHTLPPRCGDPYGCRTPGSEPDGSRSPPPAPVRQWLNGLKINWFNRGANCDHALQSAAYRPGARLAHLTRVRNPTCTAPGCRHSSWGCDLDHVFPYDQGGRTCSCNLQPACRGDHQLKQQPGWQVEMSADGVATWQLPHGRSYTTRPEPYPV